MFQVPALKRDLEQARINQTGEIGWLCYERLFRWYGTHKVKRRATRAPSGGTGQAKQSCRTTKYHFAGTERIFDFTPASQSRHCHLANSIPCDFACFRRIIGHDKHFPPRFHGFSQDFLTRGTVIPAKSGQNVVFFMAVKEGLPALYLIANQ